MKTESEIIHRLLSEYPNPSCTLEYRNPFELLVATILSAQCTDVRVNIVTKTLFVQYPTPEAFAQAGSDEIEEAIKSTGFYRNKAQHLLAMSRRLIAEFGGEVPRTLEELITLPGVGRKTANVVLGNAWGIATGFVVDTHVLRLSNRLGLSREKTPEKVETDLINIVPQESWIDLSHCLIQLGRSWCRARNPQCKVCFLSDICPKFGVNYDESCGTF